MKAVILAGGEGTRLRPFTEIIPKPMLPIGSKPILEILVEYLQQYNIDEIVLAISYLKENIIHYFGGGQKFGIKISYSKEKSLLGTAGALKKAAKNFEETFISVLGDGIADVDYNALLDYHKRKNAIGTMVIFEEKLKIPYGVLNLNADEDNIILELDEKPELSFKVNTGIVVLEPESLDYIIEDQFYNMTDFFLRLRDNNEKIVAYHHNGNWLDIGQNVDQYLNANQRVLKKQVTFNQTLTDILFGAGEKE